MSNVKLFIQFYKLNRNQKTLFEEYISIEWVHDFVYLCCLYKQFIHKNSIAIAFSDIVVMKNVILANITNHLKFQFLA